MQRSDFLVTVAVAGAVAAGVAAVVAAAASARANVIAPRHDERKDKEKRGRNVKSGFSHVKKIILVRHGESLGNVDQHYYTRIGDNTIPLTSIGVDQAKSLGHKLRKEGVANAPFRVYYSPYLRARQTALGVIEGLCGDDPAKFDRVSMRSDPRLREQDFGNIQTRHGEFAMSNQQAARSRFGRFWYRFQNGESGADVYDRVGSFFGTLTRARGMVRSMDCDDDQLHHAETIILVMHGLAMRLFLMRYLRWTVSEFERVWNPRNCEHWVLEREHGREQFRLSSYPDVRYGADDSNGLLPEVMRRVRNAGDCLHGRSDHSVLKEEVLDDLRSLYMRHKRERHLFSDETKREELNYLFGEYGDKAWGGEAKINGNSAR